MKKEMDLNCDVGESFGIYRYGADEAMMPFISSANIACGFHAGDPHVIKKTIDLAASYGVRIGAHVGFPDRAGFGTREIKAEAQEVYDYIIYQLGALDGFLTIAGLSMSHIKLHGSLYMMASEQEDISCATIEAIQAYNPELDIYALPRSELSIRADQAGLRVMNEYYADRPYGKNGEKRFGWCEEEIGSPFEIAETVLKVLDQDSYDLQTVCVHSDTPDAPHIMKLVHNTLVHAGWSIRSCKKLLV
ncbi:5-oxoprolinase subunit PxpA [Fictibacillus enclensis]|uniref:5-oxoprolinase subunit PxpA n=1 Tax=Fictibacillus enclensis TaxID=1017270 RepID=UPI0025A215C2|nr:5-oxoprolinase subunit PxpA [Fictibacillus enclensis]MDM5338693.1 5-oxoprolinase subunit PxpA [Fictibacillus enclensis]